MLYLRLVSLLIITLAETSQPMSVTADKHQTDFKLIPDENSCALDKGVTFLSRLLKNKCLQQVM